MVLVRHMVIHNDIEDLKDGWVEVDTSDDPDAKTRIFKGELSGDTFVSDEGGDVYVIEEQPGDYHPPVESEMPILRRCNDPGTIAGVIHRIDETWIHESG
ncbi:hypothetical protein ACFPYI_13815 [Halomarina salina]|uniref:YopX protein domain-containing protein n=1 Tax=Halomarina salina TaxID=1872699 RepID=A0ABD5RPU3_9EURY|nr:hypothetical protein [Halomarina salina]